MTFLIRQKQTKPGQAESDLALSVIIWVRPAYLSYVRVR